MPRRSLLDDPFFGGGGDPFQHMNNMMTSMFNDPFFSGGMMGGMIGGMPGFGQQQQMGGMPGFSQQQFPSSSRQHHLPGRSDGVTIEEVNEEGNHPRHGRRSAQQEPVVEEPDDGHQHQRSGRRNESQVPSQRQRRRDTTDSRMGGMGISNYTSGGPGSSFCYSSTSYSSGGPGGVAYSSSTTTRRGANGVSETHRQEFDGRTGEETIQIARGLGDRSRTITRKRDGSGHERVYDSLNNLSQDEASRFDQDWMSRAGHLPSTGTRSTRRAMTGGASNVNALEYGNTRGRYL